MFKRILFVPALLIILSSCQKPSEINQELIDNATEIELIKAVNQKQLDANVAFDYEGESAVWLNSPCAIHRTMGGEHGPQFGWESIGNSYKKRFENFKNDTSTTKYEFIVENYDIKIDDNIAFVTYDETFQGTILGRPVGFKSKVHKYFVKKDGEWKILAILY